MRSPIIRAPKQASRTNLHQLQGQFDSEGLFAQIRDLRRRARDLGEPPLLAGLLYAFGPIALLPFIAALLP